MTQKAKCSLCGVEKPVGELNGYDPINNNYSRAYCIRIAECDSPEAKATLNKVLDAVSSNQTEEQEDSVTEQEKNDWIKYQLMELAAIDKDDIDYGFIEIIGEDEEGREGSCEVEIPSIAKQALELIKDLQEKQKEANKLKADAVMDFVNGAIGAFESGFIDKPVLNLQQLHRSAQHHCKDNYGIDTPLMTETWGEKIFEECRKSDKTGDK